HQGEPAVAHRLPRRVEDRLAHDSGRQRRRAAARQRRHAVSAAGLVALHPRARAVHLGAGDGAAGELPAQAGQTGLRRDDHRGGEERRRRDRVREGRSLRRSGAHRRLDGPGVDLVPAAAAADRLQPRGAARGHDGDGGARVAGGRRQAARSARRQGLLRGSGRAAAMRLKAAALVAFALVAAGAAEALPPAKTMYTDALAREQTLRAALSAPDASPGVLEEVRAEIAAYEAIVRGYPASGYSDNALWQAGCLALDAFARFGQTIDRDAGIRLLRRLAAGYPASSLVAQVPAQLARVNARDAAAPRPQPARPPGSLVTI